MKKLSFLALIVTLAAAVPALAGTVTYSGTALSGLTYVGNPGDAQYVAAAGGAPALAQLTTPDSGLNGDSPAVFVAGPLGDLSAFSASYALYGSSTGPSGTSPYWILWLTDDPGTLPIVADGGSPLNASSLVHVGNLTNGSITLAALDLLVDPNSGSPYGLSTVAWAGVEIGNWGNGTNVIPASANIDSITLFPTVPEGGSGNFYLLLAGMACFAALFFSRRRGSASALAN
jgi:hypothetical protein